MEKQVTAEISFFPVQTDDYKSEINKSIEIIRGFNLEYKIGLLSTTVRGDQTLIFKMVYKVFSSMDEQCKFVLSVKYSNLPL
ncbi:MAG: thiamine-binding protein [Salinivirgaceae bacterium]|nr:thiamine-binding protein [Salinivirgaceae bacterium]